ncbi:MAG: nuclear transport factor 2 family protein [Cyclobacteriaceae bacterium]
MNKNIFFSVILFIATVQITIATTKNDPPFNQIQKDSSRIAELDRYWERLNKTVIEGDFEGNKNCFHKDAVIIFASGKNKTSVPISSALEGWKEGFKKTKEGKVKVNIELRFSQRIGNETTAHETGIFTYTATDNSSKTSSKYIIPFEMLLVKRDGRWYGMMEYQKPYATQEEWDALK